jgi:hypothetical protein
MSGNTGLVGRTGLSMKRALFGVGAVLMLLLGAGCSAEAGPDPGDGVGEASAELKASRISAGAIGYGEARSFVVTDHAHRARTLTFEGVAGDAINVDVTGHRRRAHLSTLLVDPGGATIGSSTNGDPILATLPSDGTYTIVVSAAHGANVGVSLALVPGGISCHTMLIALAPGPSCSSSSINEPNVGVTLASAPDRLTIHSTGVDLAAGMGFGPPRVPTEFRGTLPVLDQFAGGGSSASTRATIYPDGTVRVNLTFGANGVQPGPPGPQRCNVLYNVRCTGIGRL